MPGIFDMKPPRVRFEMRAEEDRNESIKAGRKVYKNVAWALVNPAGSKDEVERKADDWIQTLQANAQRYGEDGDMATFHGKLLEAVENAYERWKKGQEIPEVGMPIRMCLMFTKAEQEAILSANLRTLEELAECNEQGLALIGMGARELKARAVTALKGASDSGKLVAENEDLKAKLDAALGRIEALEEAVKVEPKRGPGRPRKTEEAGVSA